MFSVMIVSNIGLLFLMNVQLAIYHVNMFIKMSKEYLSEKDYIVEFLDFRSVRNVNQKQINNKNICVTYARKFVYICTVMKS